MKFVLDTSVFSDEKFCNWLLISNEQKFLPMIAYMEYLHHHLKKGNTESMVDAFLEQMNITVVPLDKTEAIKSAKNGFNDPHFIKNIRDYAIASTAINLKAMLVTNNIKAFKWLENSITPDEVIEKY
ncbi:MAG: type II toxin-antitoxin system VapC family toxin [Methanobacterium sp.]